MEMALQLIDVPSRRLEPRYEVSKVATQLQAFEIVQHFEQNLAPYFPEFPELGSEGNLENTPAYVPHPFQLFLPERIDNDSGMLG
jgi:hypothetical protein